ncbi:UNVERIFIED_CONTAM: hypothetical protein K2H54_015138 [Gekko kuhli]
MAMAVRESEEDQLEQMQQALLAKQDELHQELIKAMMALPQLVTTTELLDATYHGDPDKLTFFTLQVRKFLRDLGHLFPTDEHCVDYIRGKLCKQAADWFVALNNVQSLKLRDVPAFIWVLSWQYEDPKGIEKPRNHLHALRQGAPLCERVLRGGQKASKIQGWSETVLVEQYHVGLNSQILEEVLQNVSP